MCGIAGGITFRPDDQVPGDIIRRMSEAVAHRGPDEQGCWRNPHGTAVLAHRRLSIIDLGSGQQPMVDTDRGLALTYNGEVYNYRELSQDLRAEGHSLRTQSDTEVILRLFALEGAPCVSRLRGMFAFAIWDDVANTLTLARDRIGKKPLYYAQDGGRFWFASTFAAVRAALGGDTQVDHAALDAFLDLSYVPSPATIDARIRKLEPGTVMTVAADGITTHRFWDVRTQVQPFEGTYDEAVDRLDELLGTAVELRLRSDVPLGVFLSGGIDSSLVTALAARRAGTTVKTFSIGFEEAAYDESAYSAEVARRLNTEHHAFRTRYDALELLPSLVRHYGEPFGDPSAMPVWSMAKETRKHVTVVVGGDGGDEGFAGYNWYGNAFRLARMARLVQPVVARAARSALAMAGGARVARARRALDMLALAPDVRYAALRSFIAPELASSLYAGELARARNEFGRPDRRLSEFFASTPGSALRRMRATDIRWYLADGLMPKVDVATMAHALEARAPLLDHEVIEFALSLPDEWIFADGAGKRILRAVLGRYLPLSIFERPKQGFTVPIAVWFSQALRPQMDRLASDAGLLDTGWFRREGIRALLDEHHAGQRDHSQRLYNLLVLAEWLRQ